MDHVSLRITHWPFAVNFRERNISFFFLVGLVLVICQDLVLSLVIMKLLRVVVFLVLLVGVLCSVSNINLNPTGIYPKISTKGGLYVSIVMLIYVLFAELGYLPYRYKGKRSVDTVGGGANRLLNNPYIFGDRNSVLQVN